MLACGQAVNAFTLKSDFLTAVILDYGLRLISLQYHPGGSNPQQLVLGGWPLEVYEQDDAYHGAVVGRTCNRISHGQLSLGGKKFQLDLNENDQHHLHGGYQGLHNKVWQIEAGQHQLLAKSELIDGASGYPGNASFGVKIRIDGSDLIYEYQAQTDSDTLVDLTNHAYFCLDDSGSILDHKLTLASDHFVPIDQEMIPLGELREVTNTPFDFRQTRTVRNALAVDSDQLCITNGLDHSWLLHDQENAAILASLRSGIEMAITTSSPGIQVYSGNGLDQPQSGICLETQHLPDACHHSAFKTPLLLAGDLYQSYSRYRFRHHH